MLNAELSATALAEAVAVDVKSVTRWITEDRIPFPITRTSVARLLGQEESFLWPQLVTASAGDVAALAEVERVWPTRSAVSTKTWHALFDRAAKEIDILVYAGGFLIETLELADVVAWKASRGTRIRILVGDADSPAVQARAAELGMYWLTDRCRSTVRYLASVRDCGGVVVAGHQTTLYASQFRFDDLLLVNPHAHGVWACHSPAIQLHARSGAGLFDFYTTAFERVWADAGA